LRLIDILDHRRVIDHALADLVHRRADWMHVAMRRLPDAVFVVEDVVLSPRRRIAPLRHEVLTQLAAVPCCSEHSHRSGRCR
jgi:hypothetical protein